MLPAASRLVCYILHCYIQQTSTAQVWHNVAARAFCEAKNTRTDFVAFGVTVKTLYLWSRGREFHFLLGRYQAVTVCRQANHIGNTKVNLAFYPSWVGKSSTGLLGWAYGEARSPVSGGR